LKVFRINSKYTIIPEKNLIDKIKLEPRLMKLLCLLIENRGELVTRDRVIEEIWSGYGGGEDGLTQAISFLRKILNDWQKKTIETIPKSGYIFNGDVEEIDSVTVLDAPIRTRETFFSSNKKILISLVVITLAVIIYFFSNNLNRPKSVVRPVAIKDSSEKPHIILNPPKAK
jgi:DNA-binding winged helix-turn-helix (wHTH) protein